MSASFSPRLCRFAITPRLSVGVRIGIQGSGGVETHNADDKERAVWTAPSSGEGEMFCWKEK